MTLHQFLDVVEIRTKRVSLGAIVVGVLLAGWRYQRVATVPTVLLAITAVLLDMGTTGFNSFFDHFRGADHVTTNRESDKRIVRGEVAPGVVLLLALGLYALAGISGLVLVAQVGWWLLPVGLGAALVGVCYSAGPLPISSTPAGELFAGGTLGTLLVALVAGMTPGAIDRINVLAALPSGLIVASILTVNNTCDMEVDRAAGRLTLSLVIGKPAARVVVPLLGVAASAAAIVLALPGVVLPRAVAASAVCGLLWALPLYRRMAHNGYSAASKSIQMGSIARVFTRFTLALAVGLAVAIVVRAWG